MASNRIEYLLNRLAYDGDHADVLPNVVGSTRQFARSYVRSYQHRKLPQLPNAFVVLYSRSAGWSTQCSSMRGRFFVQRFSKAEVLWKSEKQTHMCA